MMFKQIPVRPKSGRNFTYIAACDRTNSAILFDPAFEPERFLSILEKNELSLEWILNTHGHHDHTNANQPVKKATNARIANHPADRVSSDRELEHGDELCEGSLTIQTLHTPGHTRGSCGFLVNEEKLISGDTLFVGKVGGTSHRGTDARQQYESIHNVIMQLPGDTEVYPGHDYGPMPHSTIEWERKHNPFVRQNSFESFCELKENWQNEKSKWESYWEEVLQSG